MGTLYAILGTLTLAAAIPVAAAPVDKPKKDGDAGKLIGTWKATGGEEYGKAMTEEEIGEFGVTIDESHWTYLNEGKKGLQHMYCIDPKAKTKTLDLRTIDARALFSFEGIYDLEGDTLKICIGGKKRPTEFKTTEDGKTGYIYIFKRQ